MEQFSIERLQKLHPLLRENALAAYFEAVKKTPTGIHPLITQSLRTFNEQADLYAQGRTKPGSIVTYAKAGQSYHNYGLALDFVILENDKPNWKVDENWMIVVDIFKKYGWSWGGSWSGKNKDNPHFEKTFNYNWRELLKKYKNKDFIHDTNYVNI